LEVHINDQAWILILKNLLQISNVDGEAKTTIISKTKNWAHESFNSKDFSSPNVTKSVDNRILNNLKKDKSIIIIRPDKGNGVVILNKKDYIEKTEEILNDKTKFKPIKGDWFKYIISLEDKLNRNLRKIKNKLTDVTYNFLFASGSMPGRLYGLPKIHKLGCPIRPILSAIGTFNYNLAKFFVPILSNLTTNQFTIKNSYSFVKEILDINISGTVFMASFDIKSLFTNIPLVETINICVDQCKENLPYDLTVPQFRSLLEIAVNESVFVFNNQLYQQKDGMSMGSPLGPTMANIFLCHHEKEWLENCPQDFKPIIYKRYIDDCFLVFREESHSKLFLDYLNCKHKNISYTMEPEKNNCLPFLDVLVTREGNKFSTGVYRKDTFTGMGLNFMSFVPSLYKINSIKTLIHRAYNICSSWINFDLEIKKLKEYFTNNGYPISLFEKHVKRFLCEKMNPTVKNNEKQIKYLRLPFLGHISYQIRKELTSILEKSCPNLTFRFVFSNNYTIGSFFNYKDRLPDSLCSDIVYKFTCPVCLDGYIGSTSRNLKIRISEHRGMSYRTNIQLLKPSFSTVREHSLESDHRYKEEDFKILYRARTANELRIAESLLIYKHKPVLNNQESAISLYMM